MDVFSRTFLTAAADAGVALPIVTRHLPVFRRCVEADDTTVLVTRCLPPDRPMQHEFLLVLTHRRLVVTQETRMLRRLRLHLNTELRDLSNVSWNPDPNVLAVELAATVVDGVRERFWIKAAHPKPVWQFDALLCRTFRPRVAAGHAERAVLAGISPIMRSSAALTGQSRFTFA
jgi:hypothetical protein